ENPPGAVADLGPALVARGEYVARLGDCVACHSVPGGAPFAGGLEMATPLGAIHATNITPDPETGIGRYSLADFDRADEAWNRGAYLVQGAGHCGSCHTPRGLAFNEKALDESGTPFLAGALLDGWYAPSLRDDHNTGLGRW
nr:alcohol dehydrogenase, putative [Tanacetum cinerariifolium]